jgi:S1-C subfamily serine protease
MHCVLLLCLCLVAAGCSKDPLSDRTTRLEEQVAQLQAESAATREALLERLDRIVVTSENEDEVASIRAKLVQSGASQTDLAGLQAQIDALARQLVDWTTPAAQAGHAVYAVMQGVFKGTDKTQANVTDRSQVNVAFLGTAFAVDGQTLITNGHMVDALRNLDTQVKQYNARRKTNLQTIWIVAQNLTTTLTYKQNYYFIGSSATHKGWNSRDANSVDVGVLRVQEGTMPQKLAVISAGEALSLKVGQPIATLGFPGELQGGTLDDFYPIATFKEGTISALRPPQSGRTYTIQDTYILQHNLDLSGGTSGSPILNAAGRVVAVNNAGIVTVVPTVGGQQTQVSQSALGFGIRADKIQELLASQPAAKPATAVPEVWRWLDGRKLDDLGTRVVGEDVEQWLSGIEAAE